MYFCSRHTLETVRDGQTRFEIEIGGDELVVVGTGGDVSLVGDGVEGVDGVVLRRRLVEEHLGLRRGNSESVPEEGAVREEELDHPAAEYDGTELLVPHLSLVGEGRGVAEGVDVLLESSDPECELGETKGPSAVASQVEGGREGLVVRSPELVGVGGEEGGELGVEAGTEVGVLALSEELSMRPRQCTLEGSNEVYSRARTRHSRGQRWQRA